MTDKPVVDAVREQCQGSMNPVSQLALNGNWRSRVSRLAQTSNLPEDVERRSSNHE